MPNSPKQTNNFITDIADAWLEEAPTVKFAELTKAEFDNKVKDSLDYREEIDSLEIQLKLARQNRKNADVVSTEVCIAVVNGVRSNPNFGENSALYKAMGYVPKNERKSGLVRPSTNQAPALKAAA
jgi:hypothetical protein